MFVIDMPYAPLEETPVVLAQAGKPPTVSLPPGGCFIAGTLVHTREGLKPIEQIKVGDYVLSKPENGGEQTYKRVTQTFRHENREVCLLSIHSAKEIATARAEKRMVKNSDYSCLVGTPNHPFWVNDRKGWREMKAGDLLPGFYPDYVKKNEDYVEDKGWTSLQHLCFGDELEMANPDISSKRDRLSVNPA